MRAAKEMHILQVQAQDLQTLGRNQEALEKFSQAFDLLIDEATVYAKEQLGTVSDLKQHEAALFGYSKSYLRQTLDAARILNTMGVLFEQIGDYDNAKQR